MGRLKRILKHATPQYIIIARPRNSSKMAGYFRTQIDPYVDIIQQDEGKQRKNEIDAGLQRNVGTYTKTECFCLNVS